MKLLSIDGGGIKGLYSAVILNEIEKRYNIKLIESFDIMAGTSIGGLIALGIAAEKSLDEIISFFFKEGQKIFPQNIFRKIINKSVSPVKPLYSNQPLKGALKRFFGENLKIKDLLQSDFNQKRKPAVCIPSINLKTGLNKVFKTPHHDDLFIDGDYYVWQVALATSAAPIYFPIAKIDRQESNISHSEYFIDGGLWGNNPSPVALTEAFSYQKKYLEKINLDQITLLSIGNVKEAMGEGSISRPSRGLFGWNLKLVLLPLQCQATSAENIINLLFSHNDMSYLRIENDGSNLKPNKRKLIKLDNAKQKSLELLRELAINDFTRITSKGAKGDAFFNKLYAKG